jgi:hypothetical protein
MQLRVRFDSSHIVPPGRYPVFLAVNGKKPENGMKWPENT